MWVWTLNGDTIRGDLVIGSCPMSRSDLGLIRQRSGVSAVLSVQHDECLEHFGIDYPDHVAHGRALGLAMHRVAMRDFDPPDQRRRLPNAVRALHHLLQGGHRVYVHCTAGINRAPLTVLGYLAFVETLPPDEAYALIRRGRPQAAPYWDAFHGAFSDLLTCCGWTAAASAHRRRPGWDPDQARQVRAFLIGSAASSLCPQDAPARPHAAR